MPEIITNRLMTAKKLKKAIIICISIAAVLFLLYFIFKSNPDAEILGLVAFNPILIAFICGLIYFAKYRILTKSVKVLEQNNIDYRKLIADINPNPLACQFKGVFDGRYAFIFSGAMLIVPYKHMAWIYRQNTKVYGINAGSQIIVKTVSGLEFSLAMTDESLKTFLIMFSDRLPDHLILGYGTNQAKQFDSLVKAYKNSLNQRNAQNNR